MSKRFFRSNRPGYPHPMWSKLDNSGIRVSVGDCNITEHWQWRSPYQTVKTVHMCRKTHNKHDEDRHMAPVGRDHGSVLLSHLGNVVTRIGLHTLRLADSSSQVFCKYAAAKMTIILVTAAHSLLISFMQYI